MALSTDRVDVTSPDPRAYTTLDWVALFLFLLSSYVVAAVGSVVTTGAEEWFEALSKPAWTPPGWLISSVWTMLYGAMAVAAWLVWRERHVAAVWMALAAWFVQLALNLGWTFAFFGLESPAAGLAEIVVLWVAIAVTIVLFARVGPWPTALLVPYLAWVTFAAALNFETWRLN